ncbi:unnamed protein product [Ilex paraguariensis]|uniref:Glycosyltransferase n=1 Tax=Ilex paraguariensis TaxID=185542 RepID=A0ABC8UJA7_9AQUA
MAINKEKEETHVLMVAFGAIGHMNPMIRLGKRLVSKGLHVTFATTEDARGLMLQSSSSSSTTNSIAGIHLEFYSDGLSQDYDRKANMDQHMESLIKHGPMNLSTIIQTHTPKFSCIINNPFVPWAADVAAAHGIPTAMLWIQPCTLYAIYYRFYNNLNPFPTSENPKMSVEIPGLPLLLTEDLPSFIIPSNLLGCFPKILSEVLQNMKKLKWVLGNSFHELENEVIDSMNEVHPIRPVGPLVPSSLLGEDQELDISVDLWKSEDACIEWLNQRDCSSVIYISFGSILDTSGKDMECIATALKNTKRPFLWVVKPPDSDVKEGDPQLPLGFSEDTKDQGLMVQWSPQTKVLAHQSVGCFLSHCGWNSLLEAITAGVPVLAFPKWTDQPTNAKLIVDVLRVGVRLRPDKEGVVSSEEVEKCIEEIMSGPSSEEYHKNATKLKRAAREAVADGGSSGRNIQWFVDELIGNSCP